uniref:hypothetical protein n=1 Tax=uncultured Draconibacterium sp. TaxID=1573823 RepID=UPI003217CBD6
MKKSVLKYIIPYFILFTILPVFSYATEEQKVYFSPENFLGNRSNNYQHIIRAEISNKIRFTNFAYLDSDYRKQENLYNIRNTVSYNILNDWSSNLAFGLKNPGFYSTSSIQFSQKHEALSYIISSGATYQKSFTSENFASIQYTPKIRNNLMLYLKSTFSINIDKKGITRGIQQFRVGVKNKQLIYGMAGNLDQFNYNQRMLANYGFFLRVIY